MTRFFLSAYFILLFFGQIYAQDPPINFGKVPGSDLEMTSYELDTEADAVVLASYGSSRVSFSTGTPKLVTFVHKRIKILKQSAFDEADISIGFYSNGQSVDRVEAQTINGSSKSDIVKVSKKDIFTEKVNDNYSRVNFSLPAVKEGSVIEYKYSLTQDGVFSMAPWFFQEELPTRLSEFRFKVPKFLEYVIIINKTKPFDEDTKQATRVNLGNMGDDVDAIRYRYVMKDMPKMVEESYVTTMDDYLTSLQFQLAAYQNPNSGREEFVTTWEKLSEDLLNSDYLGRQITDKAKRKKVTLLAASAAAGKESDEEKIAAIYKAISSNISWNGMYSKYSNKNLDKALEAGTGNTADINLSLIAGMREAGFVAEPIIVSTRSHGKLQSIYPIVSQFNHVIAYVKAGDQEYLIDATDPQRPFNLLPIFDLNQKGLLLTKVPSWVNIIPEKNRSRETVILEADENGDWSGTLVGLYSNYAALSIRHTLADESEDDYLKDLMKEETGFVGESIKIENLADTKEKIKMEVGFSGENNSGDIIYLSPILIGSYDESPFKLTERNYPIDTAYPFDDVFVLNVTTPEGYAVDEMPETVNYTMTDKKASFSYQIREGDGFIQLMSKISLNQQVYEPEDYAELKLLFEKVVEKHAEQIVYKKL